MNNMEEIIKRVNKLLSSWCCDELKDAAINFMKKIDTNEVHEEAVKFIKVLENSIMSIEELEVFANDPRIVDKFSDADIIQLRLHVDGLKDAGYRYCDCTACTNAMNVLELKEDILAL